MAQDFAIKFYKSAAWQKCRESYISSVFGLCERCQQPGWIVHHKVVLTPENINDPEITLNHDLLEYLCQDCHNKEHRQESRTTREGLGFNSNGELIQVGEGNQI